MRDALLLLTVLGAVPVTLFQPHIGVLVWSWLGYMNPQRLMYGFAYNFPFSAIIAVATIIGLLLSREEKRFPLTPLVLVWLVFILWMCVTTAFALYPDHALVDWKRSMKIMMFSFITIGIMRRRERIDLLVWMIVLSLGFYGFKGGIFTLTHPTGETQLVWGPEETFIGDNNALALALMMILPLMRYLQLQAQKKWVRHGLTILLLTSMISIIGSDSRGALVAGMAMGLALLLKDRRRFRMLVGLLLVGLIVVNIAPSEWFGRMATIQSYEEDRSAMGRINAWHVAVNLANDRPLVGGGFDTFQEEIHRRYGPDQTLRPVDAHSIYFEVLGEHGYVGFALFMLLGWFSLRHAQVIRAATHDRPDLGWARDLAGMLQVSIIGYAVGGAFLGLAYFDLYYHLIALVVITHYVVKRSLDEQVRAVANGVGTANVSLS